MQNRQRRNDKDLWQHCKMAQICSTSYYTRALQRCIRTFKFHNSSCCCNIVKTIALNRTWTQFNNYSTPIDIFWGNSRRENPQTTFYHPDNLQIILFTEQNPKSQLTSTFFKFFRSYDSIPA